MSFFLLIYVIKTFAGCINANRKKISFSVKKKCLFLPIIIFFFFFHNSLRRLPHLLAPQFQESAKEDNVAFIRHRIKIINKFSRKKSEKMRIVSLTLDITVNYISISFTDQDHDFSNPFRSFKHRLYCNHCISGCN